LLNDLYKHFIGCDLYFFIPQAERYFARMQQMGIPPDAVTAVTLLNAYSHSGEADKAPRLNLRNGTGEESLEPTGLVGFCWSK